MTRPKWHEAWQDAFEDGFEEEDEGESQAPSREKKAVAVRRKEDGTTEIVKTATGAEALKMIAEAEARGLSVEQNASEVESLMAEQNGATDVPPEVYQVMSAVIEFAQELCQEWTSSRNESLEPASTTEIEYTMDDVEGS